MIRGHEGAGNDMRRLHNAGQLSSGERQKIGVVAFGYDERMSVMDRVDIENGDDCVVLVQDLGRNAVIDSEVAIFLAGLLLQRYPAMIAARYGFVIEGMDGIDVVEAVAKKRGCIIKGRRGGEADLEKAGMILLTDYRDGKLGRISLETPDSRAAMLAAANEAASKPPPAKLPQA